jgi:hypothetical protein
MRARQWTASDDAILRTLIAEAKWSDADIAYIMGWSRRNTIGKHRRRLGLPCTAQRGARHGHEVTPETRAKIAAAARAIWDNPETQPRKRRALEMAQDVSRRTRFRTPDFSTPEGRYYRKVRRNLGAEAARAAVAPIDNPRLAYTERGEM